MSWRPVAVGAAAVGSGLVGGVLFAFSSFVMPALRRIPPAQGISAMQSINRQAPTFAFMSLAGATAVVSAGVGIHAALNRDEPGTAWIATGTVAYLAAIVITGAFNVPRNDRLATPSTPRRQRLPTTGRRSCPSGSSATTCARRSASSPRRRTPRPSAAPDRPLPANS